MAIWVDRDTALGVLASHKATQVVSALCVCVLPWTACLHAEKCLEGEFYSLSGLTRTGGAYRLFLVAGTVNLFTSLLGQLFVCGLYAPRRIHMWLGSFLCLVGFCAGVTFLFFPLGAGGDGVIENWEHYLATALYLVFIEGFYALVAFSPPCTKKPGARVLPPRVAVGIAFGLALSGGVGWTSTPLFVIVEMLGVLCIAAQHILMLSILV